MQLLVTTSGQPIDWLFLGKAIFAFVCFIVIMVLVAPPDAGVRHKDKDDDDNYPMFPPY